jgi:ABC-type bacteriocin/lantibiotic exporter with double-glycine peptidase domain
LSVHDHPVFQGLDWDVRPGTAVAVYGPAASGKSVLAEMLTGARRPQAGVVLLDGVDVRELRHDWVQNQVGVVGAIEPFAAPLENNVHLNRPHIDAQQVLTALDYVGLLGPVESLPDGVRTELQSNGRPLSSQQLACLMLARGVVNQPRLLLIDGTLDALPAEQVQGIIQRLRGALPCTMVLMTGRQELAALCDQVLDLGAQ